jgi:vancomycin permeability regulator SanA
MNLSRTQLAAREMLTEELDAVLEQLQAVRAAARDPKGESMGVLVVQLREAEARLAALAEMARDVIPRLQ